MIYRKEEEWFCDAVDALVYDAPRGKDTAELQQQIADLDAATSELVENAKYAAELAREERSAGARKAWKQAEDELADAIQQLRTLRAERGRLTAKTVTRKLEAIRAALTREPLDVAEANRALRAAISKIVINPEQAELWVYWHHAAEPSPPIPFYSRHAKSPFEPYAET